jgi:flagellar assembly factor FliW
MTIKTKDYGDLEIKEDDVITFPEGVYAFRDSKKFVVLNTGSEAGLMQLQSAESEDPRFIILDPYMFIEDYSPVLPEEALKTLKAGSPEDLSCFVIAVIPRDVKNSTVNLKSPVVINFKERLGMQVILENSEYPIRFRLFENIRAEKVC